MSTAPDPPVVVTRAESRGRGLCGELERLGLAVVHWPVIGIEETDPAQWEAQRCAAGTFDWIVFTSTHAVQAVTDALPAPPAGVRIAAVGPSTCDTLRAYGWPVDLLGYGPGAEGLVHALGQVGVRNRRILYPASSRALPTLQEGLVRLGADVVRFIAYRIVPAALDLDACRGAIEHRTVGAVTFASPSAVIELERALGAEDFRRLLAAAPAVAIGPTTAGALAARGLAPIIAQTPTLRGLALACHALLRAHPPRGSNHEFSVC